MTTASQAGLFNFQALTSLGTLAASYRLYTYAPSTTTLKTAYTDEAATIPHSYTSDGLGGSYIALDARGELPAPLYLTSGGYDLCLKTSAGATVWTRRAETPVLSGLDFVAAGASAVTRSAQDKMRDEITAADYGADSTGAVNAATALQAALTAASGKTLVINPGSYTLGSTGLTVPAGTTVIAYGATLTWSSHVTGITFTGSTSARSRWHGGKLVGAGNSSYNASGIAVYSTGTNNAPAAPTYVLGYELRDVWIDGWANYGCSGYYLSEPKIIDCRIKDIGYAGIGGLSWNDAVIDGNYIDGISPGSSSNCYGVFVDRSNGTATAEPVSSRCKIVNNTVLNATIWEGIDTHAGVDFVISNNTVSGCLKGIVVTDSNVSATSTLGPKRVAVTGNTIYGGSDGQAIILNGAGTGAVGGTVDAADGCIISDNTIYAGGLKAGNDTNGSIRLRTTNNCKVHGNTINGAWAAGISVYFDNLGVSVQDNTITDWRDDTDANVPAISVSGSNNTGFIGANTFNYAGTLTSTYTCVRSINVASGRTGLNLVFGPSAFIGIDATHLTANWGTTTGVNKTQLMQSSGGPQALSGGSISVGFSPRFPSTPIVTIGLASALNPIRASAVAADSFTATGTGTDTFYWTATT